MNEMMTNDVGWIAFSAMAAEKFPRGMPPAALHGYLTAWAIDFESLDTVSWLERALGVEEGPGRISDNALHMAHECVSTLSEEISLNDFSLPDFNQGAGKLWARDWCQGFCDAVALNEGRWQELSDRYYGVAQSLLTLRLLADPDIYSTVTGHAASEHPRFVARLGGEIPKAVFVLGDYILGDAGMPDELAGEDEVAAPDEDIELPAFSDEQLRGCSNEALMDLLVTLDDRVPESVIRECASRGDEIVPLLCDHIRNQLTVEEFEESRWWGVLHCVHVLGLVPGAAAARALIEALEIRQADPDEYIWEWVSGYWPALFANKREHARAALKAIAGDKTYEWMLRADAMECLAADAGDQEAHLDLIAAVAGDEAEKDLVRETAGGVLLDYPRERHRELLHRLAEQQAKHNTFGVHFDEMDVHSAYGEQREGRRGWFNDPLSFYRPAAILKRQRRWRREQKEAEQRALRRESEFNTLPVGTYVRDAPKIGRNDPCPCGSGRKYKKCCLST